MIYPGIGLPPHFRDVYTLGQIKAAAEASPAYNLSGMLYLSERSGEPYGLLMVPNALCRGAFDALNVVGAELPLMDGKLAAHVTVFSPADISQIGGPDKLLNDRGKHFTYTLGRLISLVPEHGPYSKIFAIRIHSPEIQKLRRSYGLSGLPHNGEWDLHLTVGRIAKGVLGRNDKSKDLTPA
jgi:hypothetical protein